MKRSAWPVERTTTNGDRYFAIRWIDAISGKYRLHTIEPRCTSRREAQAKCDEFAKRLPEIERTHKPGVAPTERLTVAQLIDQWEVNQHRLDTIDRAAKEARRAAVKLGCLPAKPGGHVPCPYAAQLTATYIAQVREGDDTAGIHYAWLAAVLRWSRRARSQQVDDDALKSLGRKQSVEFSGELLTEKQHAEMIEVAKLFGPSVYALAHCLSTYGWRPISAARMKVGDVSLARRTASLRHLKGTSDKTRGRNFEHGLFSETCALLSPIADGRRADEPLFTAPRGGYWGGADGTDYYAAAQAMGRWYERHVFQIAPTCGKLYAWKRYAITRMYQGAAPWPSKQGLPQIQNFTGHLSKEMVARYLKTNLEESLAATAGIDTAPEPERGPELRRFSVDGSHQGVTGSDEDQAKVIKFPPRFGSK